MPKNAVYPIELDRVRNLRYGMRAISLVEKKFKKPLSLIDLNTLTMEDLSVLIWAGLTHEDKSLTPDHVMDLVDEYSNAVDVLGLVTEALEGAFPTLTEEEKN